MATHAEIGAVYGELDNGVLFRRFLGACLIKARAIRAEPANTANHSARMKWADAFFSANPADAYARAHQATNYALAGNADVQFSPTNVLDSSISQAVDEALAVFAVDTP